jgi:hypothetical protein
MCILGEAEEERSSSGLLSSNRRSNTAAGILYRIPLISRRSDSRNYLTCSECTAVHSSFEERSRGSETLVEMECGLSSALWRSSRYLTGRHRHARLARIKPEVRNKTSEIGFANSRCCQYRWPFQDAKEQKRHETRPFQFFRDEWVSAREHNARTIRAYDVRPTTVYGTGR